LVRTLPFHGSKMGSNPIRFIYSGGSSMAEHLTENQKKRVRFSPFTNKKTCGRMVNAALLKSVAIKAMRVQIPPRPMLSLFTYVAEW